RRAHRRPASLGMRAAEMTACAAFERVMPSLRADQRADQRKLADPAPDARQQFAGLDTGNAGCKRRELAPTFVRSIRLEIDPVLVRRAARQEDHDHGLMRGTLPVALLGLKNPWQRHASQGQAADLQEGASVKSVTKANGLTLDRKHRGPRVVEF